MKKINLEEIAKKENLECVSTTSSITGYPVDEELAIIGLENFDQAEKLAEKYNLRIEHLKSRDGWHNWYRTGNSAYRAYSAYEQFNDDTEYVKFEIFNKEDADFFYDEVEDVEEKKALIDELEEVYKAIKELSSDESLAFSNGDYSYFIVEKETMAFHDNDVTSYAIGLIKDIEL